MPCIPATSNKQIDNNNTTKFAKNQISKWSIRMQKSWKKANHSEITDNKCITDANLWCFNVINSIYCMFWPSTLYGLTRHSYLYYLYFSFLGKILHVQIKLWVRERLCVHSHLRKNVSLRQKIFSSLISWFFSSNHNICHWVPKNKNTFFFFPPRKGENYQLVIIYRLYWYAEMWTSKGFFHCKDDPSHLTAIKNVSKF